MKSAQSGGTLPGSTSMSAHRDRPADSSLLSSCSAGRTEAGVSSNLHEFDQTRTGSVGMHVSDSVANFVYVAQCIQ